MGCILGDNIAKKTDTTILTKNQEIQILIPPSYNQSLPNFGIKQNLLHTNNIISYNSSSHKNNHPNNYHHTVLRKYPITFRQALQHLSLDTNNNIILK